MNHNRSRCVRVLGIAPSSRGFGFALMEAKNTLVDWGVKSVKGEKNARSLAIIENLLKHYTPNAIALEDTRVKESRRSGRIQVLAEDIVALAKRRNIRVRRFSPKRLRQELLRNEEGTKHAQAEALAARFPEQLGCRVPRKRRAWTSADYRMDMFDAVALAEHYLRSRKEGGSGCGS